jgi:hypothetical protein
MIITQAFAQCKQLSADQRVVHFLVFTNAADGGKVAIYKDTNMNKKFDAGTDVEIPERQAELPKYVNFVTYPAWVGIEPSGYCIGFTDIPAGTFEGNNAGGTATGDIIIQLQGKPFKMCMDIDPAAGKIRKSHFYAQ